MKAMHHSPTIHFRFTTTMIPSLVENCCQSNAQICHLNGNGRMMVEGGAAEECKKFSDAASVDICEMLLHVC